MRKIRGFFLATFTVLFQKASTYRKINQEFRKVRALFAVRRIWTSLQHSCRGQIHTEYDTIPDSCLHTLLPPQRDPTIVTRLRAAAEYFRITKKGKSGPYSITERRVPELIPVLGSQPACDVSHKPGGRLPLLSVRHAVTQATLKRGATNFAAWWTEAQWMWAVCLRLLPDSVATAIWTRAFSATEPPNNYRTKNTSLSFYALSKFQAT